MKIVTEIKVKEFEVKCPHCNFTIYGWNSSPRGEIVECDECSKEFKVHDDAEYEDFI